MLKIEEVQAYPLQWPVATPRTPLAERKSSQFKRLNWDGGLADLKHELYLLGAKYFKVSTNQPVRKDGLPFTQRGQIADVGVAVYFTLDSETICLPSDRFRTLAENLRAVVMHLEAMRGMERWGVGTSKQAFAGYKALPAVASEEPWWDVLQCNASASVETIQQHYRARLRSAHPDTGGSEEAMSRLNSARDRALRERAA